MRIRSLDREGRLGYVLGLVEHRGRLIFTMMLHDDKICTLSNLAGWSPIRVTRTRWERARRGFELAPHEVALANEIGHLTEVAVSEGILQYATRLLSSMSRTKPRRARESSLIGICKL